MKLKVGAPSYINALPLIHGSEQIEADIHWVLDHPTTINQLLYENKVDMALVSATHYLANRARYRIASNFCIGSTHEVMSVCLFLNKPIQEVKKISIPKATHASKTLLKLLCHHHWKIHPEFVNDDADAYLLIGDECLLQIKSVSQHKAHIDLATVWFEMTGYPFVFALFAAPKESTYSFSLPIVQIPAAIDIAINKLKLPRETIEKYFSVLSYSLSQEHYKSLELFATFLERYDIAL